MQLTAWIKSAFTKRCANPRNPQPRWKRDDVRLLTPTAKCATVENVLLGCIRGLEQSAYLIRLSWSRELEHMSAKNVMILSTHR